MNVVIHHNFFCIISLISIVRLLLKLVFLVGTTNIPKDCQVEHFKRPQTFRGPTFCSFLFVVALSLEEDHRQAIKIRKEETLPIYNDKLGEHPFTATIYNNLSNNFCALGEFDQAKPYSEIALKIRRKLLNEHMDTAKSLFDLGMVHKEQGDFQQAITYLEQSKNMQEKVLEDNLKDLQR